MSKIILITFFFLYALPTQAQDFLAFVQSFPKNKKMILPYNFDSTYFAKCEGQIKKLKHIQYDWVRKFIYDKINVSNLSINEKVFNNSGDGNLATTGLKLPLIKEYATSSLISYYFLQKIQLLPNHISLLIYYSDETDKKNGIIDKKIILLNYDTVGNLVSAITVLNYFTFMDFRLHTSMIDSNLVLTQIEISYEAHDAKTRGKKNYSVYRYYKCQYATAIFNSIQKEYYPYEGYFGNEENQHKITVGQNHDGFFITEGEIKGTIEYGMKLKKQDIEKGTFEVTQFDTDERWIGEFSADKNTLTITKPTGKVVYTRLKE